MFGGIILPERQFLTEPDIVEIPGVPEFFVDGAVCRFRAGVVHILAFRAFDKCERVIHEHVGTWHMPHAGFDPSVVWAFHRWSDTPPGSVLSAKMKH